MKNRVFNIDDCINELRGCTISGRDKEIKNLIYFSLYKNTDISKEIYGYHKLIIPLRGELDYLKSDLVLKMKPLDILFTGLNTPVGFSTDVGAKYIEIELMGDVKMNEIISTDQVFKLKDLIEYQDEKIVNMDIAHSDKYKFALMAFDKGMSLSEHAAPGEAIVFALDGEATIGYNKKEYVIKEGENFKFEKNGLHYVKANKKFKMALFLTLE